MFYIASKLKYMGNNYSSLRTISGILIFVSFIGIAASLVGFLFLLMGDVGISTTTISCIIYTSNIIGCLFILAFAKLLDLAVDVANDVNAISNHKTNQP